MEVTKVLHVCLHVLVHVVQLTYSDMKLCPSACHMSSLTHLPVNTLMCVYEGLFSGASISE